MSGNEYNVGLGDPNFTPWTVRTDENGKPVSVSIPRPDRSGSVEYQVDDKMRKKIDALKASDDRVKAGKETAFPGRCADALGRVDRSLGGHANHRDPKLDTKKIDGSNHVVREVHKDAISRNQHILPSPNHLRGQRGHATIGHLGRTAGLAGMALIVGGAISEARARAKEQGREATLGEMGEAVIDAVTPSDAIKKRRGTEAAIQVIESVVGPAASPIRAVAGALGADVDKGAVAGANKTSPSGALKNTEWNQRIHREQEFLMSREHPGQLCALKVKDPKTGKDMNVADALKDPSRRGIVMDEITKREKEATTPEGREQLAEMHRAANEYVELESKRREVKAETVAKAELPYEQRVAATAGVTAGPS